MPKLMKRLNKAQKAVLKNLEKGLPAYQGLFGRSALGGLSITLTFLQKHELIAGDDITEKGLIALRTSMIQLKVEQT